VISKKRYLNMFSFWRQTTIKPSKTLESWLIRKESRIKRQVLRKLMRLARRMSLNASLWSALKKSEKAS